jgi:DNA polymerase I/DNA polymerase-2
MRKASSPKGKNVCVKAFLLDADYVLEDGKPVLRLWTKLPPGGKSSQGAHGKDTFNREGKSLVALVRSFEPYFYVEPKAGMARAETEELSQRIRNLELEGKRPTKVDTLQKKYLGLPMTVLKVFCENPADVPKFRDLVKEWKDVKDEYEYGVSFYRRYLIDKSLFPMDWLEIQGKYVQTQLEADQVMEVTQVKALNAEKSPAGTFELKSALESHANPKLRILAFDLEIAEEGGEERIIMASFRDSSGFSKALTWKKARHPGLEVVQDEKALLERFEQVIQERNPDIIAGYNTDRYDFLRIAERSEFHKLHPHLGRDRSHIVFRKRMRISSAQIAGRVHVDLYDFIENILGPNLMTEVLTLDRVSREILGEGKKTKWKDLEKAIKEGRRQQSPSGKESSRGIDGLAEYCMRDSELTLMLAEHLLPQISELSRITGQTLFDVSRMSYSQLVEWLYMREAFLLGELSPNRPKYQEVQKRRLYPAYTGGYVQMPKEGIHDNIALFDFHSLYPSITITHNVSPETLDCMCCREKHEHAKEGGAATFKQEQELHSKHNKVPDESGHWYCSEHQGFIPKIIKELMDRRNEVKKEMKKLRPGSEKYKALDSRQYGLKILANASYGYYAYPGSRWYSRVCAQSITAWGRYYIKLIIDLAQKMGYEVIYGDTDSLFLKVKSLSDTDHFLSKANETLPGVMELEFRDLYHSGIFVSTKTGQAAKKRYALIDQEGKITIRGFEKVRRDWSNIAKDTQERVLLAVLKDHSPEKAAQIVRNTIDDLTNGRIEMDDLIIYSQITRPISKYQQMGPHVLAAKKAIERGRPIGEGSSISYIITRGSGSISERAEPSEDAKNYDPEYYIHNQVIPAALRVLSGLGYTEESLLTGEKADQRGLHDFLRKNGHKRR